MFQHRRGRQVNNMDSVWMVPGKQSKRDIERAELNKNEDKYPQGQAPSLLCSTHAEVKIRQWISGVLDDLVPFLPQEVCCR